VNSDAQEKTVPKDKADIKADISAEVAEIEPGRSLKGTFTKGNKLAKGRKRGSKNKSTILREKLERKTTKILAKEGPIVVQVVADAAKMGSMQAAKLIMDEIQRINARAAGVHGGGGVEVNINIGDLTRENVSEVLQAEVIDNGDE
jgi:hypothetical protein